jgi:hypothetical protein
MEKEEKWKGAKIAFVVLTILSTIMVFRSARIADERRAEVDSLIIENMALQKKLEEK